MNEAVFLLNLTETGVLTETKHDKVRTLHIKTWYLQLAMHPSSSNQNTTSVPIAQSPGFTAH
ncbi:MAG TPA: hypothetical protein VIW25_02795 [Nitrososphaeraceae archaeon]